MSVSEDLRTRGVLRRPAVALLVVLALFAMHGLPMNGPGVGAHGVAMTGMVSTGTASTGTAAPHTVGDTGAAAVVATGLMAGCEAGDHCVTTVHPRPQTVAPVLVHVADADASTSPPVGTTSSGDHPGPGRAPPDLAELSISRT